MAFPFKSMKTCSLHNEESALLAVSPRLAETSLVFCHLPLTTTIQQDRFADYSA